MTAATAIPTRRLGARTALKWIAFGLFAAVVAWRIVVVNLAEHYASQRDPAAAERALALAGDHPLALETLAREALDSDPAQAAALLERAIRANPVRGISYALLAVAHARTGETERAEKAMAAAVRLAPARVDVRLMAAAFALGRHDLTAALAHWNVAVSRRPSLQKDLFPDFLRLAEQPANLPAFATLLAEPVSWWPAFMRFAASKAESLQTVMALYSLSGPGSPNALEGPALAAVLQRLQREGLWLDARLAWMNSLPETQLNGMGNLFNGDFELPLSNVGFDWISQRAGHILVETIPTHGAGGNRALHVLFRGPRVNYRHLSQVLMLTPGEYVLHGRARADGLEANPGLVWSISCIAKGERRIGSSEHFTGRFPWRKFKLAFTVPAKDCPAQVLRLQLDGRVALDFEAKGPIWFDDMTIDRLDGR